MSGINNQFLGLRDTRSGSAGGHLQLGELIFTDFDNNSTTQIPLDNTRPGSTEGKEAFTLNFTPVSAKSKLRVDVVLQISCVAARHVIGALFLNSEAFAISAGFGFIDTAGGSDVVTFSHVFKPGSTDEITFRVRYGSDNGAVLSLNGDAAARFGGVCASSIIVTEVAK